MDMEFLNAAKVLIDASAGNFSESQIAQIKEYWERQTELPEMIERFGLHYGELSFSELLYNDFQLLLAFGFFMNYNEPEAAVEEFMQWLDKVLHNMD